MNEEKLKILAEYLSIDEENYNKFVEEVSINGNTFEYDFENYYILSSDELNKIEKDFIISDINEILIDLEKFVPEALDYFNKQAYIFDHTNSYEPETLTGRDLLYDNKNYFIFGE